MYTEGARRRDVEGLALDDASLEQLNAFFGTFDRGAMEPLRVARYL